ncbi:MAG: SIS domain-containing protein [Verrucomicrobia bacterium]|nr:SIS domain-containing protein [Verrucomicrobiota bacterium]
MTEAPYSEGTIRAQLGESARLIGALDAQAATIQAMCMAVVHCLKAGDKVLTAGNGGSAAEALHMVEELTGRFRTNRMSLPGIALPADCTALTCIGNDFGFDQVYSRQIEGLGRKGDVLVLFSTSGNSENLVKAAQAARLGGLRILLLLGRDGGRLKGAGDVELVVPSQASERIQEAHQVVMHIMLDAVELAFPMQAGKA